MSRLIKKSIPVTDGVTVAMNGDFLVTKGPKGELKLKIPFGIEVAVDGKELWVKAVEGQHLSNMAMLGTIWSLAQNAIEGVSNGFVKILEIEGVGYRAVLEGKELVLYLGYALPVRLPILEGVTVAVEKNTIKVSGIDKDLVGRMAAEIR